MKYIKKSKEPNSLAEWNQRSSNRTRPWKSFASGVKSDVAASLLKEQGYICCYCGIAIKRQHCHIEHFRPKSLYKDSTYVYTNLISSCQGEDEKRPRTPVHCGHTKGNWFDETLMVSPLNPDCASYFKYSGSGEILPTEDPERQAAAETTIHHLALSIDKLSRLRRAAIDGLLEATVDLTAAEIQQLAEGYQRVDSSGRQTPFCFAIAYILQQYYA
jgi:uncharacterized protein (TIGR02646 family)